MALHVSQWAKARTVSQRTYNARSIRGVGARATNGREAELCARPSLSLSLPHLLARQASSTHLLRKDALVLQRAQYSEESSDRLWAALQFGARCRLLRISVRGVSARER
eukprot:6833560-Prymnesium_polylepis.2